MNNLQQAKINATLNKQLNYPEGIMTRKEWLKKKHLDKWSAFQRTIHNSAAEDKLRQWLVNEKREVPLGNPNYPTTVHYLKEKKRYEDGIFKEEYTLIKENSIYVITKTEFDYYNSL